MVGFENWIFFLLGHLDLNDRRQAHWGLMPD